MPETWIGSGVSENITKAVKDVYKGVFSNPKLFTNITEIWKWVVNKIVNILKGLWNILTMPRFYASSRAHFPLLSLQVCIKQTRSIFHSLRTLGFTGSQTPRHTFWGSGCQTQHSKVRHRLKKGYIAGYIVVFFPQGRLPKNFKSFLHLDKFREVFVASGD